MQERISVRLRERGEAQVVARDKWSLVEATGDAQELVRIGAIKVRKTADVVLIEPRTLVGAFLSPAAHIEIFPKQPDFLEILKRASNRWRKHASTTDERRSGHLTSHIGLGRKFRELLLELADEGAPWRYARRVVATSMPKGRILFNESVVKLYSRGVAHRVIASKQEKLHENRIASVLQAVLRAVEATERITAEDKSDSLLLVSALGQPEGYVSAAEAQQILTELGFEFHDRPALQKLVQFSLAVLNGSEPYRISQLVGTGAAEFADLEKLWEDAVAGIASAHGETPDLMVHLHPLRGAELTLMYDGGPKLDPDIVAYEGALPKIVIDAKYSVASTADAGDVYQISSYVNRLNAGTGILAYIAPGERTSVHLIGTLESGAKVLCWSLGADAFDAPRGEMHNILFKPAS